LQARVEDPAESRLPERLSRKKLNQQLNHAINVLKVSNVVGTPEQSKDLQDI